MTSERPQRQPEPLHDLHEWDEDVLRRYPPATEGRVATAATQSQDTFRDYGEQVRPQVREFYRLNHAGQTVEFVQSKRQEYLPLAHRRMGIWDAMQWLDELTDDSDPDTELPQIEHSLQTAEAIRRDGHPRWFVLTGLIHDLGKVLCLFGEPQWAVVGDTFPVGCRFSQRIVFPDFFAENPDSRHPVYRTEYGQYAPHCGLENVLMSWGHDEYLYHVTRDYLPEPAQWMIRYHSFYAAHREGAYTHLMTEGDRERLEWVRAFNPYDLYTKSSERPDVAALRPFYQDLVDEFFPPELAW